MNLKNDLITENTLLRVPMRHNNCDVVVLKFGGTTLGSSPEDQRIKLARKTIARLIEEGKQVVPVFSALRIGRSGSSRKFSVTDFLQNYRTQIRDSVNPDLEVQNFRTRLLDVHTSVIRDLQLDDDAQLEQAVCSEIDWVCRTIASTSVAFEAIPSLDDSVVTAGERIAIQIISSYLNRKHQQGEFPVRTEPVTAMELGLYTDSQFGSANIDWPRAIEHTRETLFGRYLDQNVVPIVSGFDGIYDKGKDFDELLKSRAEKDGHAIANSVYRTSLGRGGSDLTATFLGVAVGANYVGFCKETPGVLTGDDMMVGDNARTVPHLSYQLATEAGNIYSKAVSPVKAARIPIQIFDPANDEARTIVSNRELPDGFYIMDRPKTSVNIHLGSIPDEPGALIEFLQLFASKNVNVEEIRHQRSGTDLIVCGDDATIQDALTAIHEKGIEAFAHYSWYLRIIGNVTEALAEEFNHFIGQYDPLSLAAFQLNTKVVTTTLARNRALDPAIENERISKIALHLHNRFVVPAATEAQEQREDAEWSEPLAEASTA